MKSLRIISLLLLMLCCCSVSAQTPVNLGGVKITSVHPNVAITIESCYRDGKDVIINYTMTNNLGEFTIYNLGIGNGLTDKRTIVYDNLGNSYKLRFTTFGNNYTDPLYRTVTLSPPVGIPVKGTIEIADVNNKATSFALITMIGEEHSTGNIIDVGFSFRNLPIQQWEELYRSDVEMKRVENPYIEKIVGVNQSIKSVSITNNNTKVVINYTRGQNSPDGSLWLNTENDNLFLEVDGKRYELLKFYGIGRRSGGNEFNLGNSFDYTLVFEKTPDDTQIFDLYQQGAGFYNVFTNPPEEPTRYDLPIAQTKGVVSFKDSKTTHDQRKRLTQPERIAMRINNIRNNKYINSAWENGVLSRGVQVYKDPNGSLETLLLIVKGQGANEYLMSYNAKGEFVDCIVFGLYNSQNNVRCEGSVTGSIVTTQLTDGIDTETNVYRITYDGRFLKIN